jgi:hypothetical protein
MDNEYKGSCSMGRGGWRIDCHRDVGGGLGFEKFGVGMGD